MENNFKSLEEFVEDIEHGKKQAMIVKYHYYLITFDISDTDEREMFKKFKKKYSTEVAATSYVFKSRLPFERFLSALVTFIIANDLFLNKTDRYYCCEIFDDLTYGKLLPKTDKTKLPRIYQLKDYQDATEKH